MFQTTRRRLALWYTTVTAILLLLFASGFYLYVRNTLIERIDDTLNHVVEVIQRSLVIEPIDFHSEGGRLRVNIEASFRDDAATGEDDHIDLEWFSPTGELLWSTLTEPLNVPLHPNSDGETVQVKREPRGTNSPSALADALILRQVTQRVEIGRQVLGVLRVSHPWFEVTKPARQLFFDLSLWTAMIVAAVGTIGWLLSGLAMAPVHESYQRLKQFTADASHELRSPIAIIQTNVQVALADPEPDPQMQQQHLKVIERLTRRLGRLVDDLLFLARQDSGIVQSRWVSVGLEVLLQEIIEEQKIPASAKNIDLSFHLLEPALKLSVSSTATPASPIAPSSLPIASTTHPADSWMMAGDRDQLARLFTNLISNAVQYTPPDGSVRVDLQKLPKSGNTTFQVTVRDTGIGIPAEALPHLFDRFYRIDPARTQKSVPGSGLGLAIAQAIVTNHSGQIQIESVLNQGTTVTVTLPSIHTLKAH
jgi:OmpR-family two-component system manganese-sensing sensor histidine kinase